MTKKVINIFLGLLSFLTGVLIAFFSDGLVRKVTRNLYQWATGNAFQFYGKDANINLDPKYYSIFGLTILTLWIYLKGKTIKNAIVQTGISGLLVIMTMILYAVIDGHLRVISCTVCDNGIVSIHWNDINYNLIVELSLLVGVAPLIFRSFKKGQKS